MPEDLPGMDLGVPKSHSFECPYCNRSITNLKTVKRSGKDERVCPYCWGGDIEEMFDRFYSEKKRV